MLAICLTDAEIGDCQCMLPLGHSHICDREFVLILVSEIEKVGGKTAEGASLASRYRGLIFFSDSDVQMRS